MGMQNQKVKMELYYTIDSQFTNNHTIFKKTGAFLNTWFSADKTNIPRSIFSFFTIKILPFLNIDLNVLSSAPFTY